MTDDHIRIGAEWNGLIQQILTAAVELHTRLGPGFLESIYHKGMVVELRLAGLHTMRDAEVPVFYKGIQLGRQRLDLVVASRAIIELKSVDKLDTSHFAQLRSYMAASGLPVGLLLNFAGPKVECRRVYSPTEREQFLGLRAMRVSAPDHPGISDASRSQPMNSAVAT